jgi:hypothetical protein
MRITHQAKVDDPPHPIMEGKTPLAKEFNKRQAILWSKGGGQVNFEQVTTVLLEILVEDYNKRNTTPKKIKK